MAASDISPDRYKVVIVPDHRLTYNETFSQTLSDAAQTLTQAGPKPGVPDPQTRTYATLQATGSQSVGQALRILTLTAGNSGPAGGTFGWKYSADSLYRGWDPPSTMSGWEAIDYSTTASQWRRVDAETLPNGKIIVVGNYQTSVSVRAAVRSPSTLAWTQVEVSTLVSGNQHATPCLVVLPSGRILCFHINSTTTYAQVVMSYSDNDGASWTLGQNNCLDEPIDTSGTVSIHSMRAAYLNGAIMLVVGIVDTSLTNDNVLKQYASVDLGAHFTHLDTWTGSAITEQAMYPELVSTGTEILCMYLREAATDPGYAVPYIRRVGSAYALLSSASASVALDSGNPTRYGTVAAGVITDGDLAFWRDEDGTLYHAGRDVKDSMACYTLRSADDGETWRYMGSGSGLGYGSMWWNGRDAATYPVNLCGTQSMGQGVILHQFEANPGTADDSLCAAYMGGYTTVCLPAVRGYTSINWRASWERTWLPFDLPSNTGGVWTSTVGGAPTVALSGGALSITGGVGDTQVYNTTVAPTSGLDYGMVAHAHIEVDGGTAILDMRVGVAGPASYSARVAVTTTAITVSDLIGAYTATTATTAGTTGVQVLMAMGNPTAPANDGRLRVWWRAASTGGEPDREWTLLGTTNTLSIGAGVNNDVTFGNIGGASTDVKFRLVQYTYDVYAGDLGSASLLYAGQTNPDELLGRCYASTPVYVDDGVRLSMSAGPTVAGDTWNIDTEYDYPIANIFPEVAASPRVTWRSTVETQQDIVVEYNATLDQETPTIEPVLGLGLFNINFRLFELWGYDKDTSAYVKLLDGDACTGQNTLLFARTGDIVGPYTAVATSTNHYYTTNIMEDSHVKIVGSGDGATTVIRRIRTNSEGAWQSATTKRTQFALEGVLSTDGLGGLGQTLDIWSRDCVVLIPGATKYTRYRLRILASDTAEGYFEIGTMVLGPAFYLGRQYSRGRVLGYGHTSETTTSRGGIRRVRQLEPMRRTKEFSWVEGVDVSQLFATTPEPDYGIAFTGGAPVTTPRDTPYQWAGISDYTRGAVVPMVFIDNVLKGASNANIHFVNRNAFLLGRLITDPRIESILGNELANPGEVLAVATSTISEET